MFTDYPDIVTTKQVQSMLGLSKNTVLDLLGRSEIMNFRKGRKYIIPKVCVIEHVWRMCDSKRTSNDEPIMDN